MFCHCIIFVHELLSYQLELHFDPVATMDEYLQLSRDIGISTSFLQQPATKGSSSF